MIQKSILKIENVIWKNFKYKKALFAVSSLWLWHATRTLPIIKHYLDKWFTITLISYSNALSFLKQELNTYEKSIKFIEFQDYPAIERWVGWRFYYYLVIDLFSINLIIKKENNLTNSLWDKFDFIFSDWRYWVFNKSIASYLLSHQISFKLPKKLKIFKKIADYWNYNYFKKFNYLFIPDFKDFDKSLAWKLSHSDILRKIKHFYIWPITSYYNLKTIKQDIDYYFIISWYLVEHKESFINYLLEEAKKLKGKKVFVLWDMKNNYKKELKKYNITIYSNVSSQKRIDFFNRAKLIISRAGYTTVMDLFLNNKKAILYPTKNQTEQEYLAVYLDKKWYFINWWKNNLSLRGLIT